MQALILSTDEAPPGGAAKLHPLTERIPAPLLPVLNRPLMAYPLELLSRGGLRNIGVAVHHQAGRIEAHFGAGTGHAAQLTYFLQREPLGSAGSLRWAASALKETFVVLPGDALVHFDVCAALEFHRAHGGVATVIAHTPELSYPLQAVAVGPDGVARGLAPEETPDARILSATGAYIFEPRVFDCISSLQRARPRQPLDIYRDLLPELIGRDGVYAFATEGYWNPIRDVPAYHQAQLDALRGALTRKDEVGAVPYVSMQEREIAPGILVGRRATIHPTARLVAPVYIGAGSQIERDAEVGPGAVIGANAIVDAGATVTDSCVLEGTYVGQLVKVEGRVVRGGLVLDADSGEGLRIVDPFLLGEVSPRLIARPLLGLLARAADSLVALLLLLLALPALAVIAAALLVTSLATRQAGRVIELRPRVRWRKGGEADGVAAERETYGMPHFRTRRADGGYLPMGAFLERTQLDRIPALVSVMNGDLRVVGVKPLTPAEADRLTEEWQRLPYERGQLPVSGFTGLWYAQGNGSDYDDLDEIVATDAYYTATRSFWGDVRLLLLTPVAWLSGRALPRRSAGRARRAARRSLDREGAKLAKIAKREAREAPPS